MLSEPWTTWPLQTHQQLRDLTTHLRDLLGDLLVGVYLHGSLALGSFHPDHSDLDLLVVVRSPLSSATQSALGRLLLKASGQPHPVELSVLHLKDGTPWSHPAPFEFHYSEDWRSATTHELREGRWTLWPPGSIDPDLSGHVTVARARGVALFGPAATEVFPEVPNADYLASVLADVRQGLAEIEQVQDYAVLNACRTLAYLHDGQVRSKREGGEWALGTLPGELGATVQRALAAYGTGVRASWLSGELEAFARWVTLRLPEED